MGAALRVQRPGPTSSLLKPLQGPCRGPGRWAGVAEQRWTQALLRLGSGAGLAGESLGWAPAASRPCLGRYGLTLGLWRGHRYRASRHRSCGNSPPTPEGQVPGLAFPSRRIKYFLEALPAPCGHTRGSQPLTPSSLNPWEAVGTVSRPPMDWVTLSTPASDVGC